MFSGVSKDRVLKIIFCVGLGIAVLAALENRVDWIASFCGMWGDGCRETTKVTLFHLPISIWGIIYYLVLILFSFVAKEVLFYIVMAGVGFELTLVAMMVEMKWVCVFCILNFVVVILSMIFLYEKKRIWQALSIAVIVFMASDHLLAQKPNSEEKTKALKPSVIAQVGDDFIYELELEESLSGQLYKLEKQIYDLKKERLDFLINYRLVSFDAKDKGISPEKHTFNVFSEGMDISENEINYYISTNPGIEDSWKGREEELRKRIKDYLQDIKTKEKVNAFTGPLKKKYPVKIFLDEPPLPQTSVSMGSSPVLGPEDAKVVVYEFSDYQCPSCRKAHKVSLDIRKEFEGKIRWVFKDYPLNIHKDAVFMAQAARCAGEQGKFWEYQDFLYSYDGPMDLEVFKGVAGQMGIDKESFGQCVESEKYKSAVENEKQEGKDAGVNSTPTFVINGRLRPGYITDNKMKEWIKEELVKSNM